MAWAACVALVWLGSGAAPALDDEPSASSEPSPEAAAHEERTETSPEADSETETGTGTDSETAPTSEAASAELLDPWASVPLQSVVPGRSGGSAARTSRAPMPASEAAELDPVPLMNPWSGRRRLATPRHLDPELRDPFGSRPGVAAPRLAWAELRDPFSARDAAGTLGASVGPRAAPPPASARASERPPSLPVHSELRDPFAGRKRARPTPPCTDEAAAACPPASPRHDGSPPVAPPRPTPPTTD